MLGRLHAVKRTGQAAEWYRKAAEQNHAVAQCSLGFMHDHGRGVKKSEVEAATWYRKAAEQREPRAEHALGLCYADGDGVAADPVEAYKWISLAAGHGHQPALPLKEAIEKKLTPGQKSKVEGQVKAILAGAPE